MYDECESIKELLTCMQDETLHIATAVESGRHAIRLSCTVQVMVER